MLDQQMVDFHMGNREIHVFSTREPYLVRNFWRIGTYSWSHISRRIEKMSAKRVTCWNRGGKNEKIKTCWWVPLIYDILIVGLSI